MIASQGEYHDLAVARQQAATIVVSGTSSSMDMNDFVSQNMSFNECGTEIIELTVSFADSSNGLVIPPADIDMEQESSATDKIVQMESSSKRCGSGSTDASGAKEPTTLTTTSTLPLAPDVATDYYNIITTSAMTGSAPRLFSSDAANNYYLAMSTRNLLKDDSFKTRGGTNKVGWNFGTKKSKEGEKVALLGAVEAEKYDADNLEDDVKADEDRAVDGTDTGGSGQCDIESTSPTTSVGTLKKLVPDKLFTTRTFADGYERLSNDNKHKSGGGGGGENYEEVTVETVSESSACDSSDSTVLSGNSLSSFRYSELNDVGKVVMDTIDGNTNEWGDDTIERSRSPASGSERSIEVNNFCTDGDNRKPFGSGRIISATTSASSLDELLAEAVAASATPEDVARYILDYEIGPVPSSDSKDGSQKLADDEVLLEMLLAEALVASTTPEDVARYLLEHDLGQLSQTTARNDEPKEVVLTSDTAAEIVPTEFSKNEIPQTQSWGKKNNSLSKKLRSVRSMSPSLFMKKGIAMKAKDEVNGSNDDKAISSSKCNDVDNHLKIAHSTESISSKSIRSSVGRTKCSSTALDEILVEEVAASTNPEDVARYILDHRTKEVVAAMKAESAVEVFTTDSPADGLPHAKSWGQKDNGQSKTLRSARSMSPFTVEHATRATSSGIVSNKTALIVPIPSSPNDTSPVFGSSVAACEGEVCQRECIDLSGITKCVSFDNQVIERDEAKQSKTMKAIALPPLTPRPQQKKSAPKVQQIVTPASDAEKSVECPSVANDLMKIKAAPSCGGCSIKTEYVSTNCHRNDEEKQVFQKVEVSTVNNSSGIENKFKVPAVESAIDMAQNAVVSEPKSSVSKSNSNITSDKNNVSLSKLILSGKADFVNSKSGKNDAATTTTGDKTQETTASTVDGDEYEIVYGTVLIDTAPKFCVDPKVLAEEFISDLKSVKKNMFSFFSPRKDKGIAPASKDDANDDDDSVISWSRLKRL
jgi:hypothetical protein